MKNIFLIAFLSISILAKSQTTVKGIITEQNSGNKPVVGVQIKALGANPEVSDNSGLFQLVFGSKKPGDRVIVSEIKKKGYEIVNKKEVDGWLIGSNPNQRTKVVMCPEGLIAENTAKYYDISLKAVTDGYNKRINVLQEQLAKALIDAKTYGEQAKTLSDQFSNQQNQLEELADKFARENFDDCSAIQKKAFEAFKQGNIEEAIRILETVDSDAEIAKAKQQKGKGENLIYEGKKMQSEADSIIQQNISKLMFQANLYATNYQFEEADNAYEKAVMADTTNFKNIFTYTEFLEKQKLYSKAIKYYNIANNLTLDKYNKSVIFNNLASIQQDMNLFEKAEKNYTEALKIRNTLAKENPQLYNSELAVTLSNLSSLQRDINQYDSSEINITKAINLFKELEKDKPNAYKGDIARELNNFSDLLKDKNQYEKTKENLKQALVIYRELVIENPNKYKPLLAITLNNLGYIMEEIKQYIDAETFLKEALDIQKKLIEKNRKAYCNDLCVTLTNLAFLEMNLNKNDEAEYNLAEAVYIYKELVKENPKVYISFLARSLNNLAFLQQKTNHCEKSEVNFIESLKIYKQLMEENPKTYGNDIARTYGNLADLQKRMNLFEKAEANYVEALNIRRALARENPEVYNLPYAQVLNKLAWFQYNTKLIDAINNTHEAIEIYQKVKNPDLYLKSNLAICQTRMAYYQILNKHFVVAEKYARLAIESDSTSDVCQKNLAHCLLYQGKFEEAKKYYETLKANTKIKEQIIADFIEFEKFGVIHSDVTRIRELLKQ